MNIYYHQSVFADNTSTNDYYTIVSQAIKQNRKRLRRGSPNFVYYELHHILPKSIFPEYVDESWNKVLLTATEHYLCHKLLLNMTTGNAYHRMVHAFWSMATRKTENMDRIELSVDEYENLRNEFSKSRTALQTGKVCKESTKQLIGIANKGRKPSEAAVLNSVKARKGKKKPADAVKRSADAQRGNTNVRGKSWWNNGVKSCMAFEQPDQSWIRGRLAFTESHREKIGKAQIGNTKKRDWVLAKKANV